MKISIPYGDTAFTSDFPQKTQTLTISEPELRLDPQGFKDSLGNYLRQHPLDLRNTLVVVADKTRLSGYPLYLPPLVEALLENGMRRQDLRFIIAYGTHPRQSDEECLHCYGDIYREFPFIHHDCMARETFIDCGMTSRGTPIRHRRDLVDASCLLTIGPICHHYFAGYGGGRKLIFPGCGERESIYANHGLFLDSRSGRLSSHCQPGVLNDNPIAADLFEIEDKNPADIAIHTIMDSHGRLSDILIGTGRESFMTACARHGDLCESSSPPFTVVVASCGGFPKDINFIQSHKAIHNASMFVENGGTLIIYGECRDGIGSTTFLPWFKQGCFAGAFAQLCRDYQGNGGTALATMTKAGRINMIMVSQLGTDICALMGITKWSHAQVCSFLATTAETIGYIPNASLLVRKQQED